MNSLSINKCIRNLCLADNKIGIQVANLLSGRLSAGLHEVCKSVRTGELILPIRYHL